MTYRVSWDIDIDDAASPLDAARKAHAIICRPDTSANVYNVEAPDGVVTIVDLEDADRSTTVNRPPPLFRTLEAAVRFIAGFEDDALQAGVDELLADIRAALQGCSDRQVVDEANALGRSSDLGFEEPDPESRETIAPPAADTALDRPPATQAASRVRTGLK